MEELYRQMYLKYAPNLSEDELSNKVSYALTQDNDRFVDAFYSKYTGSGPSENTQNYISTTARAMDPNVKVTDTPWKDQFELGMARWVGGGIKLAENATANVRNLLDQAENWWDGEGWEKLTVQEKMANRTEFENKGLGIGKIRLKTSDHINRRIEKLQGRQEYFDNSVTDDLFKEGNYAQGVERLALMGLGSWTSYISMLNPYAIGVLAASHAGEKWDEEWDKNPDEAGGILALNAAVTGGIEFGGDMLARRFLLAPMAGNFRKMVGMGDGKAIDAVRQMTMNGTYRFLKSAGLAMGGEGTMEMAQALAVDAWDSLDRIGGYRVGLGHDEEFDKAWIDKNGTNFFKDPLNWKGGDRKKWHQIYDEGLVGAFMGGNVNVSLQGINALAGNTAQKRAEVLLRPKHHQQGISDSFKELTKLEHEIRGSNDPDVIAKLRKKQDALQYELQVKTTQAGKIARSLRGDDLYTYAGNVDLMNKTKKKLENKDLGKEARAVLEEEVNNAEETNNKIWKDHVHQSLNKNLDTSAAYAKAANQKQEVVDGVEDYQKVYEGTKAGKEQFARDGYYDNVRESDGFNDGSGTWYINKSQALKMEAISVGSHELLHGVMKSTLKDPATGKITKEGVELIEDFRKTLSHTEAREVDKRINAKYRYQRDNNGVIMKDAEGKLIENEFEDYAEEYLNVFSDAIQTKKLKYKDNVFTKMQNVYQKLFKKKGLNKNFKDGIDVYNFMKTYDRSIQSGKVDPEIVEMLKAGATKAPFQIQKSVSIDLKSKKNQEILDDQVGETDDDGYYLLPKDEWYSLDNKEAKYHRAHKIAVRLVDTGSFDELIGARIAPGKTIYDASRQDILEDSKDEIKKHIKRFNPQKNRSLFGYINSYIANKVGTVTNKAKKAPRTKSLDTTIEGKEGSQMGQQVRDSAPTPEELMIIAEEKRKREDIAQEENLRNELDIEEGGDLYNEVIDANEAALAGELDFNKLKESIEKLFVLRLTDKINDLIGKGKKYIELDKEGNLIGGFLYKHGRNIIAKLPIRTLVEMERLIPVNERVFTKVVKENMLKSEIIAHEKQYGHSEALYYESETQGPTLYEKLVPSDADLLKFFNVPIINPKTGKRSGLKGNRKVTFASNAAIELGFDATMKVVKDPNVRRDSVKLQANKKILQERIEELGKQISRDPQVQFSYSQAIRLKDLFHSAENFNDVLNKDFTGIKRGVYADENKTPWHQPTVDKVIKELLDFLDLSADTNSIVVLGGKVLGYIKRNTKGISFEKASEGIYLDQIIKHTKGKDGLKNIEVLHVKPTNEKGWDGDAEHPDIRLKIRGNTLHIELKGGIKDSQGSSINASWDFDLGGLVGKTKTNKAKIETYNKEKVIKDLTKKAKPAFNTFKKFVNKQLRLRYPSHPLVGSKNFKASIPGDIFEEFKSKHGTTLAMVEGDAVFYKMLYTTKKYKGKHVTHIEFIGDGLYSMDGSGKIGKTTVPELEAQVNYKMRFSGNKGSWVTDKDGNKFRKVDVSTRVIGSIQKITGEKSNTTLLDKNNVRQFSKSFYDIQPAIDNNNSISFSKSNTMEESIRKLRFMDKALEMARRKDPPIKGASFIDFDDTLATSNSKVIVYAPAFKPGTSQEVSMELTPAEFAERAEELESMGASFDFSQFNDVKEGKIGPFFNKAKSLKEKFGNSDIYILTARPQEAAPAIQRFLEGVGLDIKLENIIGLADGRPEAKAEVIVEKAAEGYNDFLFADDQIKNVKAVRTALDMLSINGKTYQAKAQFSRSLNERFNQVLEETMGIDANESVSSAAAKIQGAIKNKFQFFIPPSAEDFVGLLYNFVGEGRQGEKQIEFLEEAVVKPFARAYRLLNHAKQSLGNDFKALKQKHEDVWSMVNEDTGFKGFTWGDAVRVFLWNRAGYKIPGMDQKDIDTLVGMVRKYGNVTNFANDLETITKLGRYTEPGQYWTTGNITSDLYYVTQQINRKQYLQEWIANKNEIFNPDNMNKIEALYGSHFREALEDMLYRMETGTNRKFGKNRQVNEWLNWVNNSVGAIMFFNIRSAMLQTISSINFINWTDNNPMAAAAAFANQTQFWSDFSMIFNSDTLKQRRAGLQTDVNEAELANAVARGQGSINAAISYILKVGFTPTQMADSFAIAFGGSSFYRNRMNSYLEKGMSKEEAHKIAFAEFLEISEKSQQSARPDMISQQQAGPLGRLILAFQNTPMQYMRLSKKAVLDLKNGRGDVKTNISKIVYYTTVQNIIFAGLQSALFMAMGFSDDDEMIEEKKIRALNTGMDSVLRGMGIAGATVSTLKNMLLQFRKQNKKDWGADHARTLLEAANISPPIGSKLRKLYNSFISYQYNKEAVHNMGFHIDNPAVLGLANFISASTNIPLDRAVMLINNARATTDSNNQAWQRIMTALGWNTWDVGIEKNLPKFKKSRKKKRKKKKR